MQFQGLSAEEIAQAITAINRLTAGFEQAILSSETRIGATTATNPALQKRSQRNNHQ